MLAAATSGRLVEYTDAKGRLALGVVDGVDPKRKRSFVVRDGANKASVVPERNFQLVVPGITGATKSDVAAHQSAADEALQNSGADDLELLHETLEGAAVPLEEVAALLFDDASSLRCYAAWRLLDSPRGRALFKRPKPNADSVAPRDGAEAAALLKQLDAAEAEEEALAACLLYTSPSPRDS